MVEKGEVQRIKIGGVIACTALLCVQREITQRPLSTDRKLSLSHVCFAVHVIRGMHSMRVCECMYGSGRKQLGHWWKFTAALYCSPPQLCVLTGCV